VIICARCKSGLAAIGSRCLGCFVRQGAKTAGLHDHMWWLRVESTFASSMVGRLWNDGLGHEPPTPEQVIRSLRIWDAAKRKGMTDSIVALIESVDRAARRKREGTT